LTSPRSAASACFMNSLQCENVFQKIELSEFSIHEAFACNPKKVPKLPGRDIQILPPLMHPNKVGLSFIEGQARLLHDLASIELQAFELALRGLYEFPEAPEQFRQELADLCVSEARHLKLCLDGIEKLGFKWGDWPVHLSLWSATSEQDSLLDRIFIVHRYLEGSGLDAGHQLIRRLNGVQAGDSEKILTVINNEEIDHVDFGSRWYRKICQDQGLDHIQDLRSRAQSLVPRLPKRMEKINHELRRKAGFQNEELEVFEELRNSFMQRYSK
jgi:uncharacterized ferritin-like protein (DUF455 family)